MKATRDSYAEFRNITTLWWSRSIGKKSRPGVSWRLLHILGYYSANQNVINPNEHQAFWNACFPSNIITFLNIASFIYYFNELLLYQEGRTLAFLNLLFEIPRDIFKTLQIYCYCGNFKTAVVKYFLENNALLTPDHTLLSASLP